MGCLNQFISAMPKPKYSPVTSLGEGYLKTLDYLMKEVREDQKNLLKESNRHPEDVANDINTLKGVISDIEDVIEAVRDRTKEKKNGAYDPEDED